MPSKTNHDVRAPALIGAAEKGLDPQARLYDAGRSASMPRSLSTRNFELTIRLALSATHLSARQIAIRRGEQKAAEAASLEEECESEDE